MSTGCWPNRQPRPWRARSLQACGDRPCRDAATGGTPFLSLLEGSQKRREPPCPFVVWLLFLFPVLALRPPPPPRVSSSHPSFHQPPITASNGPGQASPAVRLSQPALRRRIMRASLLRSERETLRYLRTHTSPYYCVARDDPFYCFPSRAALHVSIPGALRPK